MKKDLPQLKIGRALSRARKLSKKYPRSVTAAEWKALKEMLAGGWKYKKVAKEVGRGVNTVLRVKQSTSYSHYKQILDRVAKQRKNKTIKAGPAELNYGSVEIDQQEMDNAYREMRRQEAKNYEQYLFFRRMALKSDDNEQKIVAWLRSIAMILIGIFMIVIVIMFTV